MLFKQNARAEQPMTAAKDAGRPPGRALSVQNAEPAASATKVQPVAPARTVPSADQASGKRLIVGEGIELRGEITACDRLIVQGQVEATLNDTRVLEIEPAGRFAGSCEVEEALVSGIYEGDLVVRGRLTVSVGGRVSGSIIYGEIELERGAQIAGQLSMRETPREATRPSKEAQREAARPSEEPRREAAHPSKEARRDAA